MAEEKPCCPAAAARKMAKLTLPDGVQVGIVDLEDVVREVAALKPVSAGAIKRELLDRIKVHNYVPPAVADAYAEALFREYQRRQGKI